VASAQSVAQETCSEPLRVIDISPVAGPLRFVGLGRYVLLVISIQEVLACVEILVTDWKQPAILLAALVGLLIFGYCAWVGWKSIGVLNSVLYSKTLWAYLLICSVGGFLFITQASVVFVERGSIFDDRAKFINLFVSLWSGIFLISTSMAAALATGLVRNRNVPVLNQRLSEFLRRSLAIYNSGTVKRLPPARPRRGFLFILLGGVGLLVFTAVPLDFFVKYNIAQLVDTIRTALFALLIYARQCFQPSFQSVVAADHRPPVLFLRSFTDDEKLQYQFADRALFDFSLESRLADHFYALGPFIAVGEPKDESPHLGAARVQLSDDQWQGAVVDWIANSQLILIMAGATHWIGWEMRKVIDLGDAEKTIILFPQTKNRWRLFRRGQTTTPEVRLSVVQGAFMGTVWETGLLQLTDAQRIRSLFFEPGGRVTAITSKPKNRDSYHLAAIISHYLIRMRAQPELELGPAVLDAPLSAPLAPLGARAFAAFIDAAVFVSLYAIGLAALPSIIGTWWGGLLSVALFLAYCSLAERWIGATLGKVVAGLKVEMAAATPRTNFACLTRNTLRLVDGMAFYLPGFVVALYHPLRQRTGDLAAGTIVVRAQRPAWLRVFSALVCLIPLILCFVQKDSIGSALIISMMPFHPVSRDLVVSSSGKLKVGNFDYVEDAHHHAPQYKPGESVGFRYDVAGIQPDRTGVVDVTVETTLLDPYGLRVREPRSFTFHQPLSKVDRITESYSAPLPEYAPRGKYFADVKIHDSVAQRDLEFKPSFLVDADSVPEAYAPVIRKLQLSASQDSFNDQPLSVHPPAEIFMRAEIYGLPLQNDREDAQISGTLQDAQGKVIWDDPNFLHLEQAYPYHPPTLGTVVTGGLVLKEGFPKGIYTETYVLKDKVSGQSATSALTFEVK